VNEIELDPAAAELIEGLQRTLGIAVLVESVEGAEAGGSGAGDPADHALTIDATFMFGSNSTTVTVTGESPSQAWNALARAAIAWRNSDYQHVPMWGGGG